MKPYFPVEIFPLVMVVFTILGLLTTYGIAVGLNHTIAVTPFISNTGEFPPESGIFTIVLACSAFLIVVNIIIRCKQVWDNTGKKGAWNIVIHSVNLISLGIGFIAGVGMLTVASYTSTDSKLAHTLGADFAILFGILYFIFQTPIGPFIEPKLRIRWIQLVIRTLMILSSFVLLGLYMALSSEVPSNSTTTTVDTSRNAFLIISPVAQWLLVSLLYALFATFIPDFHFLEIQFKVGVRGKTEQKEEIVSANARALNEKSPISKDFATDQF